MIWLDRAVLVLALAAIPIGFVWMLLNWTIDTGEDRTVEYVVGPLLLPALVLALWCVIHLVRLALDDRSNPTR